MLKMNFARGVDYGDCGVSSMVLFISKTAKEVVTLKMQNTTVNSTTFVVAVINHIAIKQGTNGEVKLLINRYNMKR